MCRGSPNHGISRQRNKHGLFSGKVPSRPCGFYRDWRSCRRTVRLCPVGYRGNWKQHSEQHSSGRPRIYFTDPLGAGSCLRHQGMDGGKTRPGRLKNTYYSHKVIDARSHSIYDSPMTPRKITFWATIPCAILLAAMSASAGPQTKERAPRFNAKTLDGEKFTNENIKGKVVLMEFWTTWCVYCLDEIPFVEKINREYGDKGLIVLTINVGESKKTVKKFLEQHPRKTRLIITQDTNLP